MVQNSTQTKSGKWEIGQSVKIGFLTGLTVLASKDVRDFMPDIYLLSRQSKTGTAYYEFIPHNGLSKITAAEAVKWVA